MNNIIQNTIEYVKQTLNHDTSGHDWLHIQRVYRMALTIMENEKQCHSLSVELGALLHDIADWKFHGDHEAGPRTAKMFLEKQHLDNETISHVCQIIREVSFKGAGVTDEPSSLECKIVQDADRLDALGAIGIARVFAYGGYIKQPIYDPTVKLEFHTNFEQYKNKKTTSLNHFYEKLVLLKDRMHTLTAKKIAEQRHRYMLIYLQTLHEEIGLEVEQLQQTKPVNNNDELITE